MLRKILLYSSLIIFIGVIVWFLGPKVPYKPAIWSEPFDAGFRRFQFCKYDLPTPYDMVAYREKNDLSPGDRKMFILFKNKQTDQYFSIFRLNEITKIDFKNVVFSSKKIFPMANQYVFKLRRVDDFDMQYFLPIFKNIDFSNMTPKLEIRNIDIKSQGNLETEKTYILYIKGIFKKLAFYRVSNNFFKKYTVPVLRFKKDVQGVIAIIKDKKTGDVIFSFGCNDTYQTFDEKEYLNIIKSITFDAEPVPEAWERQKRNEWEKTHIPKKKVSEMTRNDIAFAALFWANKEVGDVEEMLDAVKTWELCEDKIFVYKNAADFYERRNRIDKAFYYITEAIKMKDEMNLSGKKSSQLYTQLAFVYMRQHNFNMVDEALRKAIEIDPDDPKIFYLYAVMEDATGNTEKAIENYKRFLKYKMSSDYERQYARERIQKLQENKGIRGAQN